MMSVNLIASLITIVENLLVWIVVIDVALGFILSPYHPVRNALDRIVNPLLAPIRRIIPTVGMFDISPMILIILVIILSSALKAFLVAL